MQETEVKFYVLNLDRIRMRLESLEAHLIQERVLETNIRFDLPDGRLRSEGRVLRLRQDTEARLTYKGGSVHQQGALSRKEIEFVVEDFEKAKLFLEALGYRKFFYYEKFRTTYEMGGCHIMLDETPQGNYVEIEGETIEAIQSIAGTLALKWETAIPASYHFLFERLRDRYPGLDLTDMSFATFKGLTITLDDLSVQAADD